MWQLLVTDINIYDYDYYYYCYYMYMYECGWCSRGRIGFENYVECGNSFKFQAPDSLARLRKHRFASWVRRLHSFSQWRSSQYASFLNFNLSSIHLWWINPILCVCVCLFSVHYSLINISVHWVTCVLIEYCV